MNPGCTPEFNQRTKDLLAQLESLKAKHAEVTRNATRQRQLEQQTATMRGKMDSGDASRPPKRVSPTYDENVMHAMMERNRVRNEFENFIAKGDRLNKSPFQKVLGIAHDIQMGSILASLHVFKKLGAAVVGGHTLSLLADTTRSVARHVPGIKSIAEQAPRYGKGLDANALIARWEGVKGAPKQALNQLKNGQSLREAALGNPRRMSDEYMTHIGTMSDAFKTPGGLNKLMESVRTAAGYIGRTHAAEKEFLAEPEFRESLSRRSDAMARSLQKQGLSAEQAEHYFNREDVQAAIGTKALDDSYESKMQGKNALSSAVDAMIGTLDRSDNAGANTLGFLVKTLLPIRKVGVNVAIQGSSLMAGGAKALVAAFKKGDMTPERADYIMKNIGQQGAGAALLTAGILYYDKLGGVPGVFSKKDQPKQKNENGELLKPGEATGFGTEAFHGAPFAMLQVGASMAQVFQKEHGKEKGTALALDVALKPTLNWFIRTVPYTDTARRWVNTSEYGRGREQGLKGTLSEITGDTLRGMTVPGVVQQYARDQDTRKGYYRPRNIAEDIESGIPGLNQNVPKR